MAGLERHALRARRLPARDGQPPPARRAGASTTCAFGCGAPPTTARPRCCSRRSRELITGVRERRHRADGARRAGGRPAAHLPADARRGPSAPGRRPARRFIVSAAGNGLVELLAQRARHGRRRSAPATRSTRRRLHRPPRRAVRLRRGQGRGDASVRRRARHRPRRSPGPTRTPPRTCRCCARSATRSPSTPTPSWRRSHARRAGRSMRFEKLGRRLRDRRRP